LPTIQKGKTTKIAVFLSKFIPSGIHIPILKGPLRGSKWIVGAAGGEAKGISTFLNLSEPEQISFVMKLIQRTWICFDIGANVGLYTLLFARYAKYVYSFEPLPRNVRYLSETLELNNINNAVIVPAAVSDSTKLMRFKQGMNYAMGKLDDIGEIPVLAISCDDFVSFYNVIPSLIKIDVEGAELSVLKGSKKLLSSHKPHILLSIHGDKMREECLDFLKKMNYGNIQPINHAIVDSATQFVCYGSS